MSSPQTLVVVADDSTDFDVSQVSTEDQIYGTFEVPGSPKSCVAWNGHEFEVISLSVHARSPGGLEWGIEIAVSDENDNWTNLVESFMRVYYPIDPRTNATDWRGAVRAYLNKAKTHWLPEHCDEDYMRDREVEIIAVLRSTFTPHIEELDRQWKITPATKPSSWPIGTPFESRAVKFLKWDTLRTFREEAIKCAITEARERYIGWYHQHPHLSHVHNLAHDCITTTLAKAPANKYALVAGEIRNAAVSLAPHAYERRWDREARLKAEAEAAAAEAESEGD